MVWRRCLSDILVNNSSIYYNNLLEAIAPLNLRDLHLFILHILFSSFQCLYFLGIDAVMSWSCLSYPIELIISKDVEVKHNDCLKYKPCYVSFPNTNLLLGSIETFITVFALDCEMVKLLFGNNNFLFHDILIIYTTVSSKILYQWYI